MIKHFFRISLILLAPALLFAPMETSIGGGFEASLAEEKSDPKEKEENAVESYSEIPAHDIYKTWDEVNIHAYSFQRWKMMDTLCMIMAYDSCDFALPHEGRITSVFGKRGSGYHHGIDIKLYKGEEVKAAFEGMVRISQYSRSYGHVVVIRHNNGLETLYAHLSKRMVKPGDHIEAGEVLGLGGNTGRSTGSHLHFECRYLGEPINPSKIVDFKEGVLKEDTIYLTRHNFKSSKNTLKKKPKKVVSQVEPKLVSAPDKSTKAPVKKTQSGEKKYHTVRTGDTLYSLARKNGVSVEEIKQWNRISSNNVIRTGTRIRVQ